ncbi:MAG: FIST C-terminal domain-containing protein [Burkholderiales bacterium]|nr:FIST C-terminal domain-containing protein [Burkholderiales bacterium]
MQIRQWVLDGSFTSSDLEPVAAFGPDLLLAFGSPVCLVRPDCFDLLRHVGERTVLLGCSTAGEISQSGVTNRSLVLTGVRFDSTALCSASTQVVDSLDSYDAGRRLAQGLDRQGLRHVLLLGPGVAINGSAVLEGIRSVLPDTVSISGGLAGDDGAFVETYVLGQQGIHPRQLSAIGLMGDRLTCRAASFHGWTPFGPLRLVTRADANLLYELDGEAALSVYKRYLGDYAAGLPASGLLFPFEMIKENGEQNGLIRTILGIDEAAGSLLLAGDVQEGGYLRLMHATTDSLLNGAELAAEKVSRGLEPSGDVLALLVSCVGRKLVMGARAEEEVESVSEVFRGLAQIVGMYSYGEIGPGIDETDCRLHNQTMSITWLGEVN